MALGMAMLWSDWNSSTTTGWIAIQFCPHSRSRFSSAIIGLTSALISMSQQRLSAAEQAWTGMSGLTRSVFVNPLYKYNGFHFQFGGWGVSTRTPRVQLVIMLFDLWLPCRISARAGNKHALTVCARSRISIDSYRNACEGIFGQGEYCSVLWGPISLTCGSRRTHSGSSSTLIPPWRQVWDELAASLAGWTW